MLPLFRADCIKYDILEYGNENISKIDQYLCKGGFARGKNGEIVYNVYFRFKIPTGELC